VALRLRLRRYGATRRYLDGLETKKHETADSLDFVERIAKGVLRRLPWSPNCLERSLVLIRVLKHYGWESSLRLGVKGNHEQLQFHAWVEMKGVVVGDHADIAKAFQPFGDDIPRNARFV
jgi:hypothetical protein